MSNTKTKLKPIYWRLRGFMHNTFTSDWGRWAKKDFSAPSPDKVKRTRLLANGLENATWIETGTYLGDTTEILSKVAKKVYTLEPEATLFRKAAHRFRNQSNVQVINSTSEDFFPELLTNITGNVVFWLDGHFSAGVTFKGKLDTPIREELLSISQNLHHMDNVVIAVDDIRCFNPDNDTWSQYPPVGYLVDWANEHSLQWHIEHDIFFASSVKQTGELGSSRISK